MSEAGGASHKSWLPGSRLVFAGVLIGILIAIPILIVLSMDSPENDGGQQITALEAANPVTGEETSGSGSGNTIEQEPQDSSSSGAHVKTYVSGTIEKNTTWTGEEGPYIVTDTVYIPEGVTLTIQPGARIIMQEPGDLFQFDGSIIAHGTAEEPIVFDGGGNSSFFTRRDYSADAHLDLDYVGIKDGEEFWRSSGTSQFGSFSVKHALIANISGVSYLWYPSSDVVIENNTFMNAAGFSIVQRRDSKVLVRNNVFDSKNPNLSPEETDYWIRNQGSYNESATILQFNVFRPADGIAVKLDSRDSEANVRAVQNYWGTTEKPTIESMIWDRNDDPSILGYVEYEPFLTQPPGEKIGSPITVSQLR